MSACVSLYSFIGIVLPSSRDDNASHCRLVVFFAYLEYTVVQTEVRDKSKSKVLSSLSTSKPYI